MARIFTWCPLVDPQGQIKFRSLDAQFGDGFKQSVGDGINTRVQAWPLSFKGKASYIAPIKQFLDDHEGFIPFQWTPPLGTPMLFEVKEYNLTKHRAGRYTLTAMFQQVSAP
ncbi:phage tail protein [Allopusillimonas ginsengisoli]|uniref:phage tail protein n=1 Tax=Allopusillimonas ginsengisoli TaxID=453575 RepID=UPI00101F8F42|nr:phage tail protein [Allopusillimonas ginsengisoli]TEA79840.1 phage tail protein [Allopusillimonas ginsengisoli]